MSEYSNEPGSELDLFTKILIAFTVSVGMLAMIMLLSLGDPKQLTEQNIKQKPAELTCYEIVGGMKCYKGEE